MDKKENSEKKDKMKKGEKLEGKCENIKRKKEEKNKGKKSRKTKEKKGEKKGEQRGNKGRNCEKYI